jgi:hypothetical protein
MKMARMKIIPLEGGRAAMRKLILARAFFAHVFRARVFRARVFRARVFRARVFLACAFAAGFAPFALGQPLDAQLAELRRDFTFAGKPVPPKVFADFGDDDLSGPDKSVRVSVDLVAASESRAYVDDLIRMPGGWVAQRKPTGGASSETETIGYRFMGTAENGLIIVLAAYSGGGTGYFHTLHVLDAAPSRGIDGEGKPYDRLGLTVLRNVTLGDRWRGSVKISGNRVTVLTEPGEPNNSNSTTQTLVLDAVRP